MSTKENPKGLEKIPDINPNMLKDKVFGFDEVAFIKTRDFLNKKVSDRSEPFYLFINPGLEKVSKELELEPKRLFKALHFMCSYWPSVLKFRAIFEEENEAYILKEDDLQELSETRKFFHPKNPDIVFEKADEIIRNAFVMGKV